MKIKEQYIIEAKHIIAEYNETINDLKTFENALHENKETLITLQNDLNKLSNSNNTDMALKNELNNVMAKYDKQIDKLHKVMFPYISKLENIKKRSSILYNTLHEKYPGFSDKQLQEQIFSQF